MAHPRRCEPPVGIDAVISYAGALHRLASRAGFAIRRAHAEGVDPIILQPFHDAMQCLAAQLAPRCVAGPSDNLVRGRPDVSILAGLLKQIADPGPPVAPSAAVLPSDDASCDIVPSLRSSSVGSSSSRASDGLALGYVDAKVDLVLKGVNLLLNQQLDSIMPVTKQSSLFAAPSAPLASVAGLVDPAVLPVSFSLVDTADVASQTALVDIVTSSVVRVDNSLAEVAVVEEFSWSSTVMMFVGPVSELLIVAHDLGAGRWAAAPAPSTFDTSTTSTNGTCDGVAVALSLAGSSQTTASGGLAQPSSCEVLWAGLVGRLLQVRRFAAVCDVVVAPSSRDFGTDARSSSAASLGALLATKTPSGSSASPSDIEVASSFVLMKEVLTLCMPIQYLLPAGTRCRVLFIDSEGDLWAEVPSAVHLCNGGALCFSRESACDFQLLLRVGATSSCSS